MTVNSATYLPTAVPSARQLAYQEWEFGLFLHFGIRTFYEGHQDFDGKPMSPEAFLPSELDCRQWARTAAEAGMGYIVMTAKHHDGFANWPSKYTRFSVASSSWKDGKGDVIREFTDACREYGLKVGLYYSPVDIDCPAYTDPKAYDDYFVNQISEILSGYGEIDMLWFDGCGSEGHEYDWPRIIGEVRRMQPNICIFNMGDPDYCWIGNEAGLSPMPHWNTVDAVPFSINLGEESVGEPMWLPAECNSRMRFSNWFYSDEDEDTVKSLDELMGLYYYSAGRGCNMMINIGPDRRGLLPDRDAARLLEFGAEIRRRFGSPIATLNDFRPIDGGWEYSSETPFLVDHLMAQDLTAGEHIRRFAVEIVTTHQGQTIMAYEGYNIGHRAICRFPTAMASRIRLRVLEADGEVTLRGVSLHYTG